MSLRRQRRRRLRLRPRDRWLHSCIARSSEAFLPAAAPRALVDSSGYDAQAVGDFFQHADLERGYAILDRAQPDAVTRLEQEILFASEHEQAWELPLQECACYVPVGDLDW